ncbi:MAG TPA: HDOD domain-containing protein [Candidatus Acidoferrum sp.]|jgi:HD-like signal output (HDOD) protein
MNTPVHPPRPASAGPLASFLLAEQERRKKRLTGILSQDLPTLPTYVLDLNALLSSSNVDLKRVGKVIRTDPSLSAQLLRLCNSALFGLRRRVLSIEQATILLGFERLRALVMTCSMMKFAGKRLPSSQLVSFWQHSFLTALLSERIARHLDYFEKEQAYLCGLLHDIGQLPLCIVVLEEESKKRRLPPSDWIDNIAPERDYFGMDHCKVGRWMSVAWNFMPSYVDVFEYHHAPERAEHDPHLVGIVAAADQFLMTLNVPAATPQAETLVTEPAPVVGPVDASFLQKCLPALNEADRQSLLEMLRTEYTQVLPLVQLGMASMEAGEAEKTGDAQP